MSFFYLNPLKGDLPLHLLELITAKRLQYLKAVLKQDSVEFNEYVIEGSIYDNVGHFMLSVTSIIGKNIEFSQFLLRAEIELFKRRMSSLSAYDLRQFACKLLKNIRKQRQVPNFVDTLQHLCQHFMLKHIAQHITSELHRSECCRYKLSVHFKNCLSFVAKRQVEISNGIAVLPCGKWKQFLVELFKEHLKYRLNRTNLTPIANDPRITELILNLKKDFHPSISSENILKSCDVDKTSLNFPPCMLNLHRNLRQKHRLSHIQRFYYSLFLKDVGMPIEESIEFWRSEYKLSSNGHSCCHNWEKDEKKFLYGIRHMYGLEGGRKNYASVSCQCIQSIDNACSEGGCPFKTFEERKMLELLRDPNELILTDIINLKKKRQYTAACIATIQHNNNNGDCDSFIFNFTPVKYYTFVSKMSTDL
ncbi:hypothetical protein K1T71_006514 [Dendrolimus kikuchii]|uniref:Uncharacterized protein n=1 Tax=Dendrolimus kikuchii TaxID=765133 RepID=A0ACC1D1A3_9NEOP|nr:hypothetical protein K1T71_006514 [Dendrolimus kikuchii]